LRSFISGITIREMTIRFGSLSFAITLLSSALFLAACRSPTGEGETGPNHTIAHYLRIESSSPAVSVETNHVFAGKTPFTLKIFGDAAGTFHNFGGAEYLVQALPQTTNQFLQTRVFRTGKNSDPGEKIPGVLFFDMSQPGSGVLIDSIPEK
jgi:hypothetical protein